LIYEESIFAEAYYNLLLNYNYKTILDFLYSSFLLPHSSSLTSEPFSKMVYTYGELNEVYTKFEREFIDSFPEDVYTYEHIRFVENEENILCRSIVVFLNDQNNELFDSIAFMKIYNKAFDGFNSFLFVNKNGMRIGCTLLNSKHDCIISPIMTLTLDTDFLYNVFLYKEETNNFKEYYYNYLQLIDSLSQIYHYNFDDKAIIQSSFDYDNNLFEDIRHFNVYSYIQKLSNETELDDDSIVYTAYYNHIKMMEECFEDLADIKTNRINPLEMLFEAEESIEDLSSDQEVTEEHGYQYSFFENNDDISLDLLDDPIQLIKKLKEEKGLL